MNFNVQFKTTLSSTEMYCHILHKDRIKTSQIIAFAMQQNNYLSRQTGQRFREEIVLSVFLKRSSVNKFVT